MNPQNIKSITLNQDTIAALILADKEGNDMARDLLDFIEGEGQSLFITEYEKVAVQDPNVLHMTATPKNGYLYKYIDNFGGLQSHKWYGTDYDLELFNQHNCYTKENGNIAFSILEAKIELQNIATELNAGRFIDKAKTDQDKYGIYCYQTDKQIYQTSFRVIQHYGIFCLEECFLEVALRQMGYDRLLLALEVWESPSNSSTQSTLH